ncbi:MAG: hypothetical protein QOE45_2026 [Frankiaceae bacterium]|jgi:hypothetical protein|nr:hypothetical protein [Frankiaceae bacterium]
MSRNPDDERGTPPRPGVLRRLISRATPLPRSASDRMSAIAADAHLPVEDVLREVADFRLALETDMIIAAAAADAESDGLLSDVLDGERAELATFHDRLLDRLADAAATDELALRRERRRPKGVSRYVAAAAAAVALLSAGRVATQQQHTRELASNNVALATANSQYADLSSAVTSSAPGAVHDAAQQLHATLTTLIEQHAGDPGVAEQAAQLLQAEISLLQMQQPAGAHQAIEQARRLVSMLKRNAPAGVRATVAPLLDAVSTPKPSASPKPKPTPAPSAKPTPKATPSSKASPTPKSTSTSNKSGGSPSPTDGGPIHAP